MLPWKYLCGDVLCVWAAAMLTQKISCKKPYSPFIAAAHTYDASLPVTAWAHAIARYKLIDYLRATTSEVAQLRLDDVADSATDAAPQYDQTLTVRKIVEALPERFRVPLTLMKVEGWSVAETASRTGMTRAAVKTNVHRGMKWIARKAAGVKR